MKVLGLRAESLKRELCPCDRAPIRFICMGWIMTTRNSTESIAHGHENGTGESFFGQLYHDDDAMMTPGCISNLSCIDNYLSVG